jgi:acyl-coenzyme A synthetase/AMP-(fatty) acid ligase
VSRVFVGGTVVVPTDPAPEAILDIIERDRVTVGFGNPDALDAMLASSAWTTTDLSAVRFVVTGGAPVPERLIRAFLERGVTLVQATGCRRLGRSPSCSTSERRSSAWDRPASRRSSSMSASFDPTEATPASIRQANCSSAVRTR